MFRSRVNCTVICELAKLETEVICDSDGICPSWRSRGVVTEDAIVSALAPGRNVETTMVGKSTSGSAATGSCLNPTSPTRSSPIIRSVVAMGRRMKGSEMDPWSSAPPPCEAGPPAMGSPGRSGRGSRGSAASRSARIGPGGGPLAARVA